MKVHSVLNLPEPRQSWIELDAFITIRQMGVFFWIGGDTYIIMTRDSVLLTPLHRTSITTHLLHDKGTAVNMWKGIKQVL